jgi:hypothetical protein
MVSVPVPDPYFPVTLTMISKVRYWSRVGMCTHPPTPVPDPYFPRYLDHDFKGQVLGKGGGGHGISTHPSPPHTPVPDPYFPVTLTMISKVRYWSRVGMGNLPTPPLSQSRYW